MMLERKPGMSMIVRTVTRWLKGPILLFGIYIVMYGHITPGGGFGGGVIIASAFILIMLALGAEHGLRIFSKGAASRLDSAGLLIFLVLGWLGTWYASTFFTNFIGTPDEAHFTLLSGGTMPMLNVALGFKVASALFLVFTVLTGIQIAEHGSPVDEPHSPARPALTSDQDHSPARPALTSDQDHSPARPALTSDQDHSPAGPALTSDQDHSPAGPALTKAAEEES